MTFEEREKLIAIIEKRARAIRCTRVKTRTVGGDCMANFKRYNWTGILIFLEDKLGRLDAFAKSITRDAGREKEFVDDAIDMRNYIDFLLIRSDSVDVISEALEETEETKNEV